MPKICRLVNTMNLDQLPYFIAIASYGSLSSASRHLEVSQQALSSYLSELEKSIGMPLFFRIRQKLYPTEAGRRYLKGAQDILNVIERTNSTIQMLGKGPQQELHMGISAHTGALMLAECALEFNQRYPGIQLVPHEGYSYQLREKIRTGEISIAMTGMNEEQAAEFKTITFYRDEFVLALPSYHPKAQKANSFEELPIADLRDFQDEVFVRSTSNTSTYYVMESLFNQAGFRPTVSFSTPNINMLTMLIRKGCGIGFLRYRNDPTLSYYRLKNPPYSYNAVIAKPSHVFSQPERFMIYLLNKQPQSIGGIRIETADLIEIIREFSPEDPLSEGQP